MNLAILKGRIGKDAEIVEAGENKLITFPFATSKTWKNKQGEKQEKTQWHRIVMWRKEALAPYLKKGTELVLRGEIEYKEVEKDGEKKYFTSINCNEVDFCGSQKNNSEAQTAKQKVDAAGASKKETENIPEDESDLPF